MWIEKVAMVASLGLVPAYKWIQRRRAQRTTQNAEREAFKAEIGAVPMAEAPAVKKGGAAAEGVPDGLDRRGVTRPAGFAPGEPLARPAVESGRVVFQTEPGKGGELPILLNPFPLL